MEWSKTVDRNACAYKEIYEILRIFPQELVAKKKKKKIRFFYNNMDNSYEYNISKETFDGQTMLEETKAILTILFRDYWATPAQKEKILWYENSAKKMLEEETRRKYNPDNLFKKKQTDYETTDLMVKNQQQMILHEKESLLSRIIKKIKSIFHF